MTKLKFQLLLIIILLQVEEKRTDIRCYYGCDAEYELYKRLEKVLRKSAKKILGRKILKILKIWFHKSCNNIPSVVIGCQG